MTNRENMLRAIRFEHPDHIPILFAVNESVYYHYEPAVIEELMESHPIIGGRERIRYDLLGAKTSSEPHNYTDAFGVEWEGVIDGIRGVVQKHPLEDFTKIPSYSRMIKRARESGAVIHMHSDGDIRALADDLIDGGVDILNLQDLVNGIDWIADRFADKTCIDLDIDRQKITVFGTPKEIDSLIRE
ncbi:MAG: hypothetical protein J6I45_08125 [Clostridia bacterium]|nr:hypothetical protein [Clostridia bacterium]